MDIEVLFSPISQLDCITLHIDESCKKVLKSANFCVDNDLQYNLMDCIYTKVQGPAQLRRALCWNGRAF